MRSHRLASALLLLVALGLPAAAATRQRAVTRPHPPPPPRDVFSAAEPAAVRAIHLELDLEVDFEARRLRGSATHTIENLA